MAAAGSSTNVRCEYDVHRSDTDGWLTGISLHYSRSIAMHRCTPRATHVLALSWPTGVVDGTRALNTARPSTPARPRAPGVPCPRRETTGRPTASRRRRHRRNSRTVYAGQEICAGGNGTRSVVKTFSKRPCARIACF